MKAEFRIQNPSDIEMSMNISMPLSDWEKLHAVLCDAPGNCNYPVGEFRALIYNQVRKARTTIFDQPDEPQPA